MTAILKDVPKNTTLEFDYIATSVASEDGKTAWEEWLPTNGWRPVNTYFLLRENADYKALQAELPAFMERYMGPEIRKANTYHLQPLNRIYLYSSQDYNLDWYGDINRVYQFSAIALLVLAIGSIASATSLSGNVMDDFSSYNLGPVSGQASGATGPGVSSNAWQGNALYPCCVWDNFDVGSPGIGPFTGQALTSTSGPNWAEVTFLNTPIDEGIDVPGPAWAEIVEIAAELGVAIPAV